MLYKLLYPLRDLISGLNVVGYISFRAVAAGISALLISFIFGPVIIRMLKNHHIGETIRQEGPKSHYSKAGTPTMGGILIHISVLVPVLLFADLSNIYIKLVLISTIWMGLIGFYDDYLKVVKKKKKGLIAKYKMAGQIILGLFIGSVLYFNPVLADLNSSTSIPFLKEYFFNFGIFYIIFVMIVINGSSNAINLSDGLDGLAAGLMAISAAVFAMIAYISGRVDYSHYLNILYIPGSGELAIFLSAMFGGMIGFLWYNAKPAEVFMGDVGSLAYGAALGSVAVLLKKEFLFFLVGGVFVMEAVSVMLQISWFRYTKKKYGVGRRIFLMAPLHHHFEEKGWAETKIVTRFWILGILFAMLSLATFKIR